LTPPTDAPGARRLTRVPLLIGSSLVALCAGGAAVAAAQTTTTPAETPTTTTSTTTTTTTTSTTDDAAAASEDAGGDETSAGDGSTSGEDELAARRAPLRLKVERVKPRKLFIYGGRKADFVYETGGGRADLRIAAVRKRTGDVVQRWTRNGVSSGERHHIFWKGEKKGGGKVGRGTYLFRVRERGGKTLARQRADGKRKLGVYPAKFPVRARHQYWDGWGAGRGHQGQDIGARCGARMVAAKAGRVAFRGYDGGGYGHYLAINIKGSNHAHVYAHLKNRPAVRQGARVKTGQRIGKVGQTGNASGCHLHFEYWKGSWGGGRATPAATKVLRKGDKWS
jgi:murein DD-endopeptidase MepM/ murein hydrolase activator NlpD